MVNVYESVDANKQEFSCGDVFVALCVCVCNVIAKD
jgi:hypothetical protein